MASILPFIRLERSFDDSATRAMGEAFDAACAELKDSAPSKLVREVIAERIIEAAKKGERNPVRLRDAALAALGYGRDSG